MDRRRHTHACWAPAVSPPVAAAVRAALEALAPSPHAVEGDWLDVLRRAAGDTDVSGRAADRDCFVGLVARQGRPACVCDVGTALSRPEVRRAVTSAAAGDGYGWGTRGL